MSRYILPALAMVSTVIGMYLQSLDSRQSTIPSRLSIENACSCSTGWLTQWNIAATCSIDSTSTTTISNPAGASALAACSTYSGNIAIVTGAASNKATVNLDGVQEIDGSLTYQNDDTVAVFQASQLTKILDLSLGNLTKLPTLNLPALSEVRDLNITGLSTLGSLGFGNPGISKARNVLITNTVLNTLAGVSNLTEVEAFNIVNNPYLSVIDLSVTAIKGAVDIGANNPQGGGQSINLPKLETAGQLTFRNASKVSLPSLANVSQNLGLYGNTFDRFATPLLTFAGGIVLVDNAKLTNISMPLLTTINGTNGTYQISNNTNLKSIEGFEELSDVKGGLDFSGNFSR